MKKIIVLLLIVAGMSTVGAAQEKPAEPTEPLTRKGMQATYLELWGNGLFLTLNYEKFLTKDLGFRVGGIILPVKGKLSFAGTIMGTALWGDGPLCMEAGLGVMALGGEYINIATDDVSSVILALTGTIGIRWQPKRKGLILRLGFTPIVFQGGVLPWVGISIGSSF